MRELNTMLALWCRIIIFYFFSSLNLDWVLRFFASWRGSWIFHFPDKIKKLIFNRSIFNQSAELFLLHVKQCMQSKNNNNTGKIFIVQLFSQSSTISQIFLVIKLSFYLSGLPHIVISSFLVSSIIVALLYFSQTFQPMVTLT